MVDLGNESKCNEIASKWLRPKTYAPYGLQANKYTNRIIFLRTMALLR